MTPAARGASPPPPSVELAVNYSPAVAGLVREGVVNVGAFKVPDEAAVLREASALLPSFVHFDLVAGSTTSAEQDLERIADLRASAASASGRAPARVNVQLAPSALRFPDNAVDSFVPTDLRHVTDVLCDDVARVCARFGSDQVVIGTLIYRGAERGLLRAGVEPGVVTEVAERCACGLLLDLAHARLNAMALEQDRRSYLGAMPVERLRELHLSGIGLIDGRGIDHLGLADLDGPSLDDAAAAIMAGAWRLPERLVFDYGGVGPAFAWRSDARVLATQLPLLEELAAEFSARDPKSGRGTSLA